MLSRHSIHGNKEKPRDTAIRRKLLSSPSTAAPADRQKLEVRYSCRNVRFHHCLMHLHTDRAPFEPILQTVMHHPFLVELQADRACIRLSCRDCHSKVTSHNREHEVRTTHSESALPKKGFCLATVNKEIC